MTIILIDVPQVLASSDEAAVTEERFLELAIDRFGARAGLQCAHGGVSSDRIRMHLVADFPEVCHCGETEVHKKMNETIDSFESSAKRLFSVNRQVLLEALAGIPGSDNGEIYFYSTSGEYGDAVIVSGPDVDTAAIIMPMTVGKENPLSLPRIVEVQAV